MKVCAIVILALIKLGASEVDEELQEKFRTLSRSDFVEYFNQKDLSWKIKQYTNITINMIFGTDKRDIKDLQVKYINDRTLDVPRPASFDARRKWPHCFTIKKIRNQHFCGSCWAHAVADVASDRLCIHTGLMKELSVQDLECSHTHQTICYGGDPEHGFKFWKDYGIVPEQCKPYDPFDLNRNTCVRFCKYDPFLANYLKQKYLAADVYVVPKESDHIKTELFLNGPISASMPIYEDFADDNGNGYHSGIYEHKYGKLKSYHAVRVIGYGVENGVEYWLAANSWGPGWGEEGLFRIKSYQLEIGFENFMMTGIPVQV